MHWSIIESTIVVSVSGYPAFYKNIRTYAPGDDEAFLIKSLIGSVKTPTVDKPNTSVAVNEVVEKVQEVKTVKKNTKGLFAIGIEASRPMGDFSTYNKLGLGAYTKLGLKLSKGVALYTDLSYLSYGGKTYTETSYDYYGYPHYYTNKYSSISIFRYLGGLDINLTKGLYGTLQGGMCSITEKDGSSSIKTNAFNWSIGIGYTVSKFDVGLLYNSMLNSDWEKPLNSLGLRLGFKL